MVKSPVKSAVPASSEVAADDRVFKALASADRRRLLDALKEQPLTTSSLCQTLPGLNRCTVMQHLQVLETAGLVSSQKRGRQRWYSLDVVPIQGIYERWISRYAAPAAALLHSLHSELDG